MRIGELLEVSGATKETVRYYESISLLPPPRREESGYRIYSEQTVELLYFIRHAQDLGFTLEEIRHLIELDSGKAETCLPACDAVEKKISNLESMICKLQAQEAKLRRLLRECKNEGQARGDDDCSILRELHR